MRKVVINYETLMAELDVKDLMTIERRDDGYKVVFESEIKRVSEVYKCDYKDTKINTYYEKGICEYTGREFNIEKGIIMIFDAKSPNELKRKIQEEVNAIKVRVKALYRVYAEV